MLSVFTVDITADTPDANWGDGLAQDEFGNTSFRAAIQEANNWLGKDTIEFDIPGAGPHKIQPTSALDAITEPVIIDGYTQPGASPNTQPLPPAGEPLDDHVVTNAELRIELDGTLAGGANGLTVTAGNSTVRGLVINRFSEWGISIEETGVNVIEGNYIGTNVTATQGLSFLNGGRGIYIAPGADGNVIGTNGDDVGDEGERNVISGHYHGSWPSGSGVQISSDYNVVAGNFIGTDSTGTKALGNFHGVNINGDHNLIGTNANGMADEAERNIISGNFTPYYEYGSDIRFGGGLHNVVAGNFLGTDVTGTKPMDVTSSIGILFHFGTSAYNQIGTNGDSIRDEVERNIISGHDYEGVTFGFGILDHNLVAGNYIGTDVSGTEPLGNEFLGVGIMAVTGSNQIGGTGTLGNTIAFNGGPGIALAAEDTYPTTGNKFQGNSIHSNNRGDSIPALGIDLTGIEVNHEDYRTPIFDGRTLNDPDDIDPGPNNFQNFPVITLAQAGPTTRVAGTLNSIPDATFTLDFYANTVPDPSGHGEGERYLGWATLPPTTKDEFGNVKFDVVLSGATAPGEFITATATEQLAVFHGITGQPTGSTSEFAKNVVATETPSGGLQGMIDTLNGTILTLNYVHMSELPPLIDEIAALTPRELTEPVITIVVNLEPGTFGIGRKVEVPAGFIVEFNGFKAPVTFEGNSPALTLKSGELHVIGGNSVETHVEGGVTFTNTTDAPTILVEGGTLHLRKCVIEETTGGDRAAVQVVGGTVDLGTAADAGENTIIVNGAGDSILTAGPGTVSDVGNTVDFAPDFDAGSDVTLVSSQPGVFSREITFADPDPDEWSGTVSFGDGSTDELLVIDQVDKSFALNHTYTEEGTFTVTVTVEDNEGGRHSDGFQVTMVFNQPPSIHDQSFAVDENQVAVGAMLATDPNLPDDTLTYSISGGPDGERFTIDAATGVLTFLAAPDFEMPVDANKDNLYELEVTVADDHEASDTSSVNVNVLNLASISGDVFVDVNQNGLREANERGIDGVIIELLDELGNAVLDDLGHPVTATTSGDGFYLFEDLVAGTYQLHEIQPTGVDDGTELLGSLGGSIPADDTMQLIVQRTDATDYIFSEIGQQVSSGDTASIGFWQNKHGNALIQQGGAALANWLTTNFSNVFGAVFTGASATGTTVADFYRDELFRQKAQKGAGPAKVDCQFMATALATFFTSRTLAGDVAADYGFDVTDTGIGTKVVNVGDNGEAYGVANGSLLTIMGLLQATNANTDLADNLMGAAHIYDLNGDGIIDAYEASLRRMANNVYAAINEEGSN